jgi:hypothetical protein
VELGTNQIHAWQVELGYLSTNQIAIREELPPNQTDVWLIRGKPLKRSELVSGVTGSLPVNTERLQGSVEMLKNGGVFHINVHLSGDSGVKLLGIFDSYKALWRPLLYPYILIFGPFVKW